MSDIVLLDGGMGQELVRRSAQPAHPQWSAHVMIHEPGIVQAVHADYLRAGARVLTLNTYSTTPGRFERFGMPERFEELQLKAVELARAAMEETGIEATVAGCLSPLAGSYHPELVPPEAAMLDEYRRIVEIEAPHVDLFLCETMSTAAEGRAAAMAAAESGRPVWLAWTLAEAPAADGTARLRSGETVAEALAAVSDLPVAAVLANCCPPEMIGMAMPALVASGLPAGGYANAFTPIPEEFKLGTTVDLLGQRNDLGPEAYADHAMRWVDAGAAIVGGCCEVGPAHIAEIAGRLEAAGHRITGWADAVA